MYINYVSLSLPQLISYLTMDRTMTICYIDVISKDKQKMNQNLKPQSGHHVLFQHFRVRTNHLDHLPPSLETYQTSNWWIQLALSKYFMVPPTAAATENCQVRVLVV